MRFTHLRRIPILAVLLAYPAAQVLAAPSASAAAAAAETEVRLLVQLMVEPTSATLTHLSQSFHFRYREAGCRRTDKAEKFCSYEIDAQQSEVGRILTLELGGAWDKRRNTGRVVWVPWVKDMCVTTEQLAKALGEGHVIHVDAVDIAPGDTAVVKAGREIEYTRVPGAATGSAAVASFYGPCLLELTVNF